MKKLVFVFAGAMTTVGILSLQLAFSSTDQQKKAAPAQSKNTVAAKGKQLMEQADCKVCHKEKEQLVGPSFEAIAKKYPHNPATINTLANKVIKGGSGNWGEAAMIAHPNLKLEDAKAMVTYILDFGKPTSVGKSAPKKK